MSGKTTVSALIRKGRWGVCEPLRYCFLAGNGREYNRILLSVPKKFFKRAVKRNLLKRRLREAYRTQKSLLPSSAGVDLLLTYSSTEILSSAEIRECVAAVLSQVAGRVAAAPRNAPAPAPKKASSDIPAAAASNHTSSISSCAVAATPSTVSPAAAASNHTSADGEE